MKPFKMFFCLVIATMFFLFVARVVFFAFIVAAVMSIIYAIYRRIKDFVTYDRYREYYIKEYDHSRMENKWKKKVEPLFYENFANHRPTNNIRFTQSI